MNYYITAGITACAFVAGFLVQGWRMDSVISDIHTQHSKALATATQQVLDQSIELQRKKDAALQQAQVKAKQNATAAAAAQSELDGMREYNKRNSASISSSTCTSVRDYAATATAVFEECSIALEGMARKADAHALDAKTLIESWPTSCAK
jgi:HD-like signal output (HDOD) protein